MSLSLAGDWEFDGYRKEATLELATMDVHDVKGAIELISCIAPKFLPVGGCWVLCRKLETGQIELIGEWHSRILEGKKYILYKVAKELII